MTERRCSSPGLERSGNMSVIAKYINCSARPLLVAFLMAAFKFAFYDQYSAAGETFNLGEWTKEKTWDGLTVFGHSSLPFQADKMGSRIVEVNMLGEIVWEKRISGEAKISGLSVLSNGNILFTVANPRPHRGAYEVNREGKIVWRFVDKRVSHKAVRLDNGNTLITAGHSEDFSPWPYQDPQVFEIDQAGTIVWSFYFKDVFASNPKYKDIRSYDWGSWSHVNYATRLPNGSTLISARNFNMALEVDARGRLVRAYGDECSNCGNHNSETNQGGALASIHSPVLLPNGNLLVNQPTAGRVIEYSPTRKEIVWQFQGRRPRKDQRRDHLVVRGSQRLPNGNTLVVDSNGQLIEVTENGEIVWRLRSPYFKPDAWIFFEAERIRR
jgi:hypothetical protein